MTDQDATATPVFPPGRYGRRREPNAGAARGWPSLVGVAGHGRVGWHRRTACTSSTATRDHAPRILSESERDDRSRSRSGSRSRGDGRDPTVCVVRGRANDGLVVGSARRCRCRPAKRVVQTYTLVTTRAGIRGRHSEVPGRRNQPELTGSNRRAHGALGDFCYLGRSDSSLQRAPTRMYLQRRSSVSVRDTWLSQEAYDRLKAELDELIANRPASPPRSTPGAKRATSRRTAATTPPARSRASRRRASATCRNCCAPRRSARRRRRRQGRPRAPSSPSSSTTTKTTPRRSCSAPGRSRRAPI